MWRPLRGGRWEDVGPVGRPEGVKMLRERRWNRARGRLVASGRRASAQGSLSSRRAASWDRPGGRHRGVGLAGHGKALAQARQGSGSGCPGLPRGAPKEPAALTKSSHGLHPVSAPGQVRSPCGPAAGQATPRALDAAGPGTVAAKPAAGRPASGPPGGRFRGTMATRPRRAGASK